MDRRTFIASSAALGLTTTPSAAAPIDPIVPMFSRWEAATREWQQLLAQSVDMEAPCMLALNETRAATHREIASRPAQSIEGLRCQLVLYWEEFGPEFFDGSKGSDLERTDPASILLARIIVDCATLTDAPQWQNLIPPNPAYSSIQLFPTGGGSNSENCNAGNPQS